MTADRHGSVACECPGPASTFRELDDERSREQLEDALTRLERREVLTEPQRAIVVTLADSIADAWTPAASTACPARSTTDGAEQECRRTE